MQRVYRTRPTGRLTWRYQSDIAGNTFYPSKTPSSARIAVSTGTLHCKVTTKCILVTFTVATRELIARELKNLG